MKSLILALLILFLAGCTSKAANNDDANSSAPGLAKPVRAVYLVKGQGQLAASDLKAHPEVVVTDNLDVFRKHAMQKVALWIDKNATGLMHTGWLNQAPQAYYPIVLVGYSDTLFSFEYNLALCCFSGPIMDWSSQVVGPGFSVIQRQATGTAIPRATFLHGFTQSPSVEDVLGVTNALLDGQSVAIPMPTETPVAIATPQPITRWITFRDVALGVQIEYPSTWQVDAENTWALFYDPNTGQAFNIARGDWIKKLPNDFVDHVDGTVTMTQTLTLGHQPAVLVQFQPLSALGEYQSQVAVIAPDGHGLIVGDKTEPKIFQHALTSIVFLNP